MATSPPSSQRSSAQPTLSQLLPQPTDRALFVGQTGGGKTTLARFLLAEKPYVVVHDAKIMLDRKEWPGYRFVSKLRDAVKLRPEDFPRIIYQPNEHEVADHAVQNAFFRWLYRRGNTTVYVDETVLVQIGGVWPRYHFLCITQGRGRGVEMWSGMQRPSWVPLVTLSEAEHIFLFRLQYGEDRIRMEGVTGLDEALMTPRALPKQTFWYVQTGEEARGPFRLDIEGR